MNRFYVTGISGVGKSSLTKELRRRGVEAFDLDDTELCRWKHIVSGEEAYYQTGIGSEWLKAHEYICDCGELEKMLTAYGDTPVFVAGLASNQNEFLHLFDTVFLLHCAEKTFLHRLNTREGNEFAKDRFEQEYILSWYKGFEEKLQRKGALPINTEAPLQDIADEVLLHMSPL